MQKYRIRPLRLEKGWSQEQLATIAGLSTRTVQRIENGEQASLETLTAIAAALGDAFTLRCTKRNVPCKSAGYRCCSPRVSWR